MFMPIHIIAIVLTLAIVNTGVAHAGTLPAPDLNWRGPNYNLASPPTDAVFGNGWLFYAAGSLVYGRYAANGRLIATPYQTGGIIQNAPALVKLSDGRWYLFVASGDGKLYKFDVANSILAGTMQIARTSGIPQIRDAKRPSSLVCAVHDSLTASPVVQLAAQSSGDYRLGRDLVMVGTHHGCGGTTTNKMYAFYADDITHAPAWVLNDGGDYSIDYWTSCVLDYARNRIHCGSNLSRGAVQLTLWSIDTISGSLVWGSLLGRSVQSRPALGVSGAGTVDHLYVADVGNTLHALDPASGKQHWALQLGTSVDSVTKDLSLGSGAYAGLIIATTSFGRVVAAFDNGPNPGDGEVLWSEGGSGSLVAITKGEVVSTSGKVYVGSKNATLHQLNLATGSDEGFVMIDGWPLRDEGSLTQASVSTYRDQTGTKLVASRSGIGADPAGTSGSATAQFVLAPY